MSINQSNIYVANMSQANQKHMMAEIRQSV